MTATTLKTQAMDATTRLASKVISTTRDMTAVSGDVSYTGVGFVPTSIIVLAAIDGTVQYCIGAVDSSRTETNLSNSAATQNMYTELNNILSVWAAAGGNQTAVVKSFDSDGFTLTWTKYLSPTGTMTIKFLCFR